MRVITEANDLAKKRQAEEEAHAATPTASPVSTAVPSPSNGPGITSY